jgi:hypothetical protein
MHPLSSASVMMLYLIQHNDRQIRNVELKSENKIRNYGDPQRKEQLANLSLTPKQGFVDKFGDDATVGDPVELHQ